MRSVVQLLQRRPLVHGDVIGLVAFDLVLRLIGARVPGMPLVVGVFGVHLGDLAGHMPGLGVPPHVVTYLEFAHRTSIPVPVTVSPIMGYPGTSPPTSRPPEVCASASSSRSPSPIPGPGRSCGRTQSRLRRVPPETKPSRRASRAPSITGTA